MLADCESNIVPGRIATLRTFALFDVRVSRIRSRLPTPEAATSASPLLLASIRSTISI